VRTRLPPPALAAALGAALAAGVVFALRLGPTAMIAWREVPRGLAAAAGLAEPLEGARQLVLELRLWRALTAAGVGGALALSGALLQGLFRNALASPSLLGVSSGASLGASLAIVALGGYGPAIVAPQGIGFAPLAITGASFAGSLAGCFLVARLASSGGRISVPTLLLVGVAINTCVAGLLAALQSWTLSNFVVAREIMAWTFGTLDDRLGWQAGAVLAALALSALAVPFVAVELDLFALGEDDASGLGVDTRRVKLLVLVAAALSASVATAVAGQISFVGLVVPHCVRLLAGTGHRRVLWLSVLGGAAFLLGTDVLQTALLGERAIQPGVLMSLVGGPSFLWLLVRHKRLIEGW
jgi:iron complex transport system permease protein